MIVSYKITNMPVERVDVSAIPCLECVNKIVIPGLFFRYSGTGITQQGKHDHDKDQYPARDQVGVTLDRPVLERNWCRRRCQYWEGPGKQDSYQAQNQQGMYHRYLGHR
jgi:hypothetical protein